MPNPSCDPYSKATYSLKNRIFRGAWGIVWMLVFRPSPKIFWNFRNCILRIFGAKIGAGTAIHPTARIWAPWNLRCDDMVALAEFVEIYNPSLIQIGSHSIISQGAYLCGATHNPDDPTFPLVTEPIYIDAYAWICSRAAVLPGVRVGEGSVLGLMSVASRDLAPWTIYAGQPAKRIRSRSKHLVK